MIRKLLLPALLMGLLGGCVTAGYSYRDGYYYGQPSVEYRYHDYGYGYYPGYYPYGYYPYGERYRYYYGYPYYRGYPHYGYPYYGYPYSNYYYRPHHKKPRPPVTWYPTPNPGTHPGTNPGTTPGLPPPRHDGHRPPPWRNLDGRTQSPRVVVPGAIDHPQPPRVVPGAVEHPQPPVRETPRSEPRRNDGSRMEQAIRRGAQPRRNADSGDAHER